MCLKRDKTGKPGAKGRVRQRAGLSASVSEFTYYFVCLGRCFPSQEPTEPQGKLWLGYRPASQKKKEGEQSGHGVRDDPVEMGV